MLEFQEPPKVTRVANRGAFVKSPHYNEEEYGCQICLEPVCHPRTCKVCKLLACRDCMERCKKTNSLCPKKCTQGQWKADEATPFDIEFTCPYSVECKDVIHAEDFTDHFFKCQYVPEQTKNEYKEENLKKRHRCTNGHDLEFLGQDKIFMVTQLKCCGADCTKGRYCRSRCEECGQAYCCMCRLPAKITTRKCPLGHPFKIRKNLAFVSCDVCSRSANHTSAGFCYNDQICDFAVCVECMANLPVEESTEQYALQSVPTFSRGPVLDQID